MAFVLFVCLYLVSLVVFCQYSLRHSGHLPCGMLHDLLSRYMFGSLSKSILPTRRSTCFRLFFLNLRVFFIPHCSGMVLLLCGSLSETRLITVFLYFLQWHLLIWNDQIRRHLSTFGRSSGYFTNFIILNLIDRFRDYTFIYNLWDFYMLHNLNWS